MKRTLSELLRNEKGQALPIVLLLLLLGGLIIAPLLGFMSTGVKAGQLHEEKMHGFYAADAGVELALWHLTTRGLEVPEGGQSDLPEFTMNNKTVNVTIENMGEQVYQGQVYDRVYRISSTAGGTPIKCYVGTSFDGDYTTFPTFPGGFFLGQGVEHTGDVYAEGNVHLGTGATTTGDIYAEGNVQLEFGATITGDIYAEGNVQLGEGAQIKGDVCAGGDVQLDIGATMTRDVYAEGNVQLAANAMIKGDVYLGGTVSLDDGAEITGDYPLPYEGCPLYGSGGTTDLLTWQIS